MFSLSKLFRKSSRVAEAARPVMEPMEGRQLMSATPIVIGHDPLPINPGGPIIIIGAPQGHGVGLRAEAGETWSGDIGTVTFDYLYPSASGYQAVVNWGDGTAVDTNIGIRTNGLGTLALSGSHTYATAGKYNISITLETIPPKVDPPTALIAPLIIAKFNSSASIRPDVEGGTSLIETATQKFSADIGTFDFSNVDEILTATISWGDGTTYKGVVVREAGADSDDWVVQGTHTYEKIGDYKVHVEVFARPVALPPNVDFSPLPFDSFDTDVKVYGWA